MKFVLKRPQQHEHTIELTRPFSHLVKMQGIKSGLLIPVRCSVMQLDYRLVTPRRIKLQAGIKLVNDEVALSNGSTIDGVRIYWKNKPQSIPENQSHLNLEHIFKLPSSVPGAKRIMSVSPTVSVEKSTTLTNRIVVKGMLKLKISYQPR